MAEPQLPVNTVNIAYRGQSFNLENYPEKKGLPRTEEVQEKYKIPVRNLNYEPASEQGTDIDFTDLEKLNHEIVLLRIRIHQTRNDYRKSRRIATHLKYVYEQAKKRAWIQLSGGSEKTREAVAEIMTQDAYTEFLVADTIANELNDLSRTLRTELDALKEVSNNLRRQIDIQ